MIIGRRWPLLMVSSKLSFYSGFCSTKSSQWKKLFIFCPRWLSVSARLQFSTTAFLQSKPKSVAANDLRGFYGNPLMEIQTYLQVPILPNKEICFNPLMQEMKAAEKLFLSYKKDQISFLKSVIKPEDFPETNLPEVAFIGRSNVGKSSLIQALFHKCPDVKVNISSKPGHTKTLNFFQVRKKFFVVDMPGYGYNMPQHFIDSVEVYLRKRRMLCRTFLLLDSEIGITKADNIALEMFDEFRIPYVLVFTKIDKVNRYIQLQKLLSVLKIQDQLSHCCFSQPFFVSSKIGNGIPFLQAFIGYITGNLKITGH